MTEDFLHYIWKFKLFNLYELKSHSGENIQIISSGTHNKESGPDFSTAKLQIGGITWAGQVEIHIDSSDWYKHHHQNDEAYSKVILHVVWNNDSVVLDLNQNEIPTIVLKGRVSQTLINTYSQIQSSKKTLVCQGLTQGLDSFKIQQWLNRLLIERLETKTKIIQEVFEGQRGNWSQTFFISLAKNLGFKINALPMQLLAESIDFKILLKSRESLILLESILLGVSGLLDENSNEEYPQKLHSEFAHQKAKYNLKVLKPSIWKFGGTRPSNFPTLRLVQFAKLIHQYGDLFEVLVRDYSVQYDFKKINITASEYWNTHYVIGTLSISRAKSLGNSSVNNILINTVAPMLFFYGKTLGEYKYQDVALSVLEKVGAEDNSIVKNWARNNIIAENASQSQALIELTNSYCKPKKCLNCGIGNQILKS